MEHLVYIFEILQHFVKSKEFIEYTIYFSIFGICLFLHLFVIYPISIHIFKKGFICR